MNKAKTIDLAAIESAKDAGLTVGTDAHNIYVAGYSMGAGLESEAHKKTAASLSAEIASLRAALEKIASSKNMTRLAPCCVDRLCHINEDSGSCSFQTGVWYANGDRAAEAEEALKREGMNEEKS